MSETSTDQWRRIASAPKDGSRILAVIRGTEQGPADVDVVRWTLHKRGRRALLGVDRFLRRLRDRLRGLGGGVLDSPCPPRSRRCGRRGWRPNCRSFRATAPRSAARGFKAGPAWIQPVPHGEERQGRVSNHEAVPGCRLLEASWFETRFALLTMRHRGTGRIRAGGDSHPTCRDAQKMVRQHAGDHRLADRHGADADAGVVAAFGDDLGARRRG